MGAPTVLSNLREKAFYFAEGAVEETKDNGPLDCWNNQVRDVTKLSARKDL